MGAYSCHDYQLGGLSLLGDRKSDIWGCDFRPEEGDFGDPDLRTPVDHARPIGKSVLIGADDVTVEPVTVRP
jgi:hypothetical protein